MLPLRKKILIFNNTPFMPKALRKAIMHRLKLKIIYIKKDRYKLGKLLKKRIFVSRYFGELRKTIFKI